MSKNLLEVVRIKDPQTGAEYNATRAHAKNIHAQVLDKPTHDPRTKLPIVGKPRADLSARRGAPSVTVSETSTVADIDAYAADHAIDLSGATNKTDKLAAIAAADQNQEA